MNAIKTYKIANKKKFSVEFGYVVSRWHFRIGDFTLIEKVPGGLKVSEKIAEALHKAWHRCGKIDGTCRTVINRLLNVRTLADWKPDRDWWSNAGNDGDNVPMIYIKQKPVKGFGPEDLTAEEKPSEVLHNAFAQSDSV